MNGGDWEGKVVLDVYGIAVLYRELREAVRYCPCMKRPVRSPPIFFSTPECLLDTMGFVRFSWAALAFLLCNTNFFPVLRRGFVLLMCCDTISWLQCALLYFAILSWLWWLCCVRLRTCATTTVDRAALGTVEGQCWKVR